ncbi:MAG TPA: hypothetical protein VL443_28370 [Cyclobacteriaceae bacterium]|jgi:hypothetical protein|nr:hypothetical protein [Cyclobacteriaceae bacterium]
MLRIIILLIIGLHAVSFGQSLKGQVYQLAESFLEDNCSVNPECDCCSSDLIFLTDKQFSLIARCIFNDVYYTGTYSIKGDYLVLTFKQTIVSEIVDEETSKVENKREDLKIEPIKFNISTCKQNKIRLENAEINGKDLKNGSRKLQVEETKIIQMLKKSSAWKLLTH